jgi:hypothetical protein
LSVPPQNDAAFFVADGAVCCCRRFVIIIVLSVSYFMIQPSFSTSLWYIFPSFDGRNNSDFRWQTMPSFAPPLTLFWSQQELRSGTESKAFYLPWTWRRGDRTAGNFAIIIFITTHKGAKNKTEMGISIHLIVLDLHVELIDASRGATPRIRSAPQNKAKG